MQSAKDVVSRFVSSFITNVLRVETICEKSANQNRNHRLFCHPCGVFSLADHTGL
jgi:hypothetical protein